MQSVRKKTKKPLRYARWMLLAGLLLLLAGSIGAWRLASKPEEPIVIEKTIHSGTLYTYAEENIASLRITLRSGESWQLTQDADGNLAVDGDSAYQVAQRKRTSLLSAAAVVTYEDVLTEDALAYAQNYADFGLDTPRVVAEISYRDGTAVTLRIGDDHALEDTGWSYMLIDGDPRLYAIDTGTADALTVEKADLHPIEQPVLHKARFDRITLTGEDGQVKAAWVLQGDIGGDANDRWQLTVPLTYPADGESMSNLHDNLENIRLGAYVGEATPENLTKYGFHAPRFVIEIHMAAGSIGSANAAGEYEVVDWPESSFTLTVGAAKNDAVDYVRVEDSIYLTSHYSLAVFMNMKPVSTLTRFVAPTALGNLASLRIAGPDTAEEYVLTRTEQVAENNELVYDAQGNIVYDVTCTRNGESIAYTAFEAAYNNLLIVTVSGTLSTGWQSDEAPHTTYTFTQTDGVVHVVELVHCDAFHDAVVLDGNTMFYLIKDGMAFNLE